MGIVMKFDIILESIFEQDILERVAERLCEVMLLMKGKFFEVLSAWRFG